MNANNIKSPGIPILKYQYQDFDFVNLIKQKKDKKLKIGLGIPVKNEEDTLADVINSVKKYGVERGLIDKVIIFDSSSTDSSIEIAKNSGIEFIVDQYVAKEFNLRKNVGWKPGKGFNLWASLKYLGDCDIITWVDSDIDLKARHIYGVLGPLISQDSVLMSKGTYERDITDSRVSRYTVDPILGLLFPEAGQLADPLCGFFGGRTKFLQSLPFTTGYSVEVATVVHAMMNVKANQIAQVNLGKLNNRDHTDLYLSAMSTTITKTILDLAEQYNKISLSPELAKVIVQRDCSTKEMTGHLLANFEDIKLMPMAEYLKTR